MNNKSDNLLNSPSKKNEMIEKGIFYKEIVKSSPDAIFIENLNGEIIDLSDKAAKMLGYERDELIGKNVELIIPKHIKKKLPYFLEQLKNKKYLSVQTYNLHKKGYLIPVEISASLVEIEGKELAVIISRDLRRKEWNEMKYRIAIDLARDAIIMIDPEGRIEFWNNAAEKIFGYKKEEIMGKKFYYYLVPEEYKPKMMMVLKKIFPKKFKGVRKYPLITVPAKRKNGEIFYMEKSPVIFSLANGVYGLIIARDVTKRKKQEKKLSMLYKFVNAISTTLKLDEIFKIAYEELRKIVDMDSFTIALVDEREKKLSFEFIANAKTGKIYGKDIIDLDDKSTLTGWIAVHGQKLYIKNVEKDKLPANVQLIGEPMLSFLGVPMIYGGKIIGVLTVQSERENAFGNEDIQTIETLAAQLTMRIVNAKLYRKLKISEEKYKSLINASNVGIVATDLDNRITFTNEKFAEMLGYEKEELMDKIIMNFATEEGYKKMMEGTKRRRMGISDSYESSFVRKDGKIINVEIYASSLRDEKGRITGTIGVIIDTTEKKIMEKNLIEVKNRFQMLFNTMADPVTIIDFQGFILDVTNKVEEITGFKKNELIGKNFMTVDFLTEESKRILKENLMKRMMRKKIEPYEIEVITKDGKKILFDVNAVMITYKGKPADLVVFRDITERRKMEEKIKEEREKYKKLFDNMGNGVVVIQDEKIVFINSEFNNQTGYVPEEVIGEKFTKFVSPDLREFLLTNYRRRMMDLPVPKSYIIKILRKDGKILWAQVKVTVVNWEGKKADMVSIMDITPLKEIKDKLIAVSNFLGEIKHSASEEEIYKRIVDFLYDVLGFRNSVILKLEGDILKIVKKRGYENANFDIPINGKGITAWVARNNTSYYAPDVKKEKIYLCVDKDIRCEYATPVSIGDKIYGVIDVQKKEVDSITKDDRLLIDMLAMHLALLLQDIESKKELKRAIDIQELMLHIISHDLKNPLAVIGGYSELLEIKYDKEYVKRIGEAVREAKSIIEKARTFSKINMNKIEEKRENINLKEVIEEASKIIKEEYGNVKIETPKKDVFIIGYPIMKEVFVNLMDNAFKYGADEVKISIEEKENIKIKVADNGIGIPEENKEIIFEIFKKMKSRGSGLGLSIVKKIVEIHGGRIWVEDNKPKGSVFVIELPKV